MHATRISVANVARTLVVTLAKMRFTMFMVAITGGVMSFGFGRERPADRVID